MLTFTKTNENPDSSEGRICDLEGTDTKQLKALFGTYHPQAQRCPSDGYTGKEWWFKASDGVFLSLYNRSGHWRIGGPDSHGKAFVAWLQSKCPSLVPARIARPKSFEVGL